MHTYQFYVVLVKPFEDCKGMYTKKRKKARLMLQDHVVDICSFCLSSIHLLFLRWQSLIPCCLSSTHSLNDRDIDNSTPVSQVECVVRAWPIGPLHFSGQRDLLRDSYMTQDLVRPISRTFVELLWRQKSLFSSVFTQKNGCKPGAAGSHNKEPGNKANSEGNGWDMEGRSMAFEPLDPSMQDLNA